MKTAIINFSDGKYIKGQNRLRASLLEVGIFNEDIFFFSEYAEHWPKETEVFKGFKPYILKDIEDKGYDAAIWIDATCICVRPLTPILKIMRKTGLFVFSRYNTSVGEWISDYSLQHLHTEREPTHKIPELCTCVVGVNFKHPNGREFADQWLHLAQEKEAYNGVPDTYTFANTRNNNKGLLSTDSRVRGHRTDQSMAGIIAGRLNIFPTNRYIFDLIGESAKGKTYASYIPLDIVIVQNRDIKTDICLKNLSHYTIPFKQGKYSVLIKTYTLSYWRYCKDIIKWFFFYKKRYSRENILLK